MSMNNSDFGQMGTDITQKPFRPDARIPADDPHRKLTVADPDNPTLGHISIAGGTYTILVTGAETAGRYCLIDILVHSGGGPPPRNDARDFYGFVNHLIRRDAPDAHRIRNSALKGGKALVAIAGGRGLHDSDRPDVVTRAAGLVDEEIDMRLKESAGAELDDPPVIQSQPAPSQVPAFPSSTARYQRRRRRSLCDA